MPNYNTETGVAYGVITMNQIDPDVADALWYGPQATNVSWNNAMEDLRNEVESEARSREEGVLDDDLVALWEDLGYIDREDFIEGEVELRADNIYIEEQNIEGEYEGVSYGISWLGGSPLLWVFESPHISTAAMCSPCAPGAGNLNSLDADGIECYDVPPEWRREE